MESHLLNLDFLKIPPTCGLKIKLYNVNVHIIRLEIDCIGLLFRISIANSISFNQDPTMSCLEFFLILEWGISAI